jgi:hypothetical protein
MQVSFSSALEGGHVISDSPCTLLSLLVRIDSTLASGTYYVQVFNASSAPANGAGTLLLRPFKVQHLLGVDDELEIDITVNGVRASAGVYVCVSSTEFSKTIVGSYASFEGGVL